MAKMQMGSTSTGQGRGGGGPKSKRSSPKKGGSSAVEPKDACSFRVDFSMVGREVSGMEAPRKRGEVKRPRHHRLSTCTDFHLGAPVAARSSRA